jgi:hypothetical protein
LKFSLERLAILAYYLVALVMLEVLARASGVLVLSLGVPAYVSGVVSLTPDALA